jgi:hypothetical protein
MKDYSQEAIALAARAEKQREENKTKPSKPPLIPPARIDELGRVTLPGSPPNPKNMK